VFGPLLHVIDVLVQRASQSNIQDLHPSADAQNRHPPVERASGEGKLELVPARIGVAECVGWFLPVVLGENIAAAREQQAVTDRQDVVESSRNTREDHRYSSRRGDRPCESYGEVVSVVMETDRDPDHWFQAAHRRIIT
jgi:hypothetical protein